ncbi:tetratricopeptide repeat protein, partial [Akkermansiaceae bacterium]|nr:tetratricopeptide repeat protein [Akkermansiaceae bacterium]
NLARLGWLTFQLSNREDGVAMLQTAEKYQRENLTIDDEDYQRTLCSLAEIFAQEGKLKEAAEIAQRVIAATRSDSRKPTHLWVTNTLAGVYRSQGRTHEAERLFSSLIDDEEREMPGHPRTIEALHTACQLQLDLGKIDEAERMAKRGYEIALRTLGPTHRTTFLVQGDLAMVSQRRGQVEDATKRFEEVLALQKAHLGNPHPHTIRTLLALADLKQDEVIAREASALASGSLGAQDALSIRGLTGLAQIIAEQGRVSDARQIYERLRDLSEEAAEPGNVIAMQCKDRLARFEARYGDANKADRLYLEILERHRELYDENDERNLDALLECVRYLRGVGRYAEALDFGIELCKRRRALNGRPAIKLIRAYRELAEAQKARLTEAGALFYLDEALELAESELGPGNETTLELKCEQAALWKMREHPSRVVEILGKALPLA